MRAALAQVDAVPVLNMNASRAAYLLGDASARFRIGDTYREQLEVLGAAAPGEALDGATFATVRFVRRGTSIPDAIRNAPLGMTYYGNIALALRPDALRGAALLPTMSIDAIQARNYAGFGMRARPSGELAEVMAARLAADHTFLSAGARGDVRRTELLDLLHQPRGAAVRDIRAWLTSDARVDRGRAIEGILREVSPADSTTAVIERLAHPDDSERVRTAAARRQDVAVVDRSA